jgi:predicted nuclease of predicted toxin-antitoxin system
VKLLFDENLSPRLVVSLAAEYPASVHARNVGLRGAEDHQIWDYACAEQFAVVTKDSDFRDRSYVQGFPPKIIWLDVGNAGTAAITELLQRERGRVERFGMSAEASVLILSMENIAV